MDRVGGFLFCCAALYLRHGPAEAASTFARYVGTALYDNRRYVLPLKIPFRGFRVFHGKKSVSVCCVVTQGAERPSCIPTRSVGTRMHKQNNIISKHG